MTGWSITCNESRACFLKEERPSGTYGCPLLNNGYPDGACPFAKAVITDISYHTLALRIRAQRKKELEAAGL